MAQSHDTLNEVKVLGKKSGSGDIKLNEFAPGQLQVAIDTATLQQYRLQSVATLLSQQAAVFVKTYSFNGLATLNFRGASAAQSQVLWNGVPIQNAALGLADVSELPVMVLSKVSMEFGGSAALWGSGNVGGALLLENEAPLFDSGRKQLSFSAGAGSFGQYTAGLEGSISSKKWYLSLKAMGQSATDNFSFTNEAGKPENMPNNSLSSGSVMVKAGYNAGNNNVVSFTAWYQDYNREVPPALFEPYSVKKEADQSVRLLAEWDKKTKKSNWYTKSSLIKDNVNYQDSSILLHTINTAWQYYQEAGWGSNMGGAGRLLVFVPVQITWMNLPDSNTTKSQARVALAVAYDKKFLNQRLDIAVNGRAEAVNGTAFILPGADAGFRLADWLSLRANVQRTYRVPTLNELYYFPGGNTTLKPEQGWSEDAGYTIKLKNTRLSFRQDASLFNRDIHDWIIWLGGAIWTPHNIAEVHSRGAETENRLDYRVNEHWLLHLGLNTSYVLATTVSSYIPNDGSIGKQIPYMPRYNGQANIGFTFRRLYVNYNHTYTGYRFTVADESEYLMPYNTGNLQAMYSCAILHHAFQFTAQCNNIWDNRYAIIAYRPMPGINWLAGFKVVLR